MTSNSSADSFVPQILKEVEAIEQTDQDKGQLCGSALDHAIKCGELLVLAKESVEAERGKKGSWQPWLQGRFGIRMPLSTAGLYMKLYKNKEFLFGKMQLVGDKRMSLRQAAALIPLTAEGEKKRATAAEKAAKRKAEKEAAEKRAVAADLSTEDRVSDLAVDEIFTTVAASRGLDVDEIFMALKSTLDNDQLLDLSTRLTTYLDEQTAEPEEQAEQQEPEQAPEPSTEELVAKLKEMNQQYRRV